MKKNTNNLNNKSNNKKNHCASINNVLTLLLIILTVIYIIKNGGIGIVVGEFIEGFHNVCNGYECYYDPVLGYPSRLYQPTRYINPTRNMITDLRGDPLCPNERMQPMYIGPFGQPTIHPRNYTWRHCH